MPVSVRAATHDDVPQLTALSIRDAEARRSLDPLLWRIAADGPTRIARSIEMALERPGAPAQEHWLVAEQAGRLVGHAHATIVPVPPIYDAVAGSPGVLLDDCFVADDAPSGTAEALLAATEAVLREAGVATLVASCPTAGPLRPLYERHGYEPVTLYMAKHGFSAGAFPAGVRLADSADVPAIVGHSAAHRQRLAALKPRFWHIHPEADARFDAWMRRSLTLRDRELLVGTADGRIHGYVIAQPCPPLLLPVVHEAAAIGVIDDFYDESLADTAAAPTGGSGAEALLAAAERAFARRAVDSTMVVCPAAWSSKVTLLESCGYRVAKLWLLKR